MFETLLARLAGALSAAGIPYMVIGGQAVLLYGAPRLTEGSPPGPLRQLAGARRRWRPRPAAG